MASLQSDTTSLTVLFIHAFSQDRDNILNPSSCIHKRSLLLHIWRYENRKERERYYFCLETDINGKLQTKLPVQATSIKPTKKLLCWQVLAKDLSIQTIQFSIYMKLFNTKDNLHIWIWWSKHIVTNIVLANSDLKSWTAVEEVLLWPSKLVLRGYQDSSRFLSFICIWIYL